MANIPIRDIPGSVVGSPNPTDLIAIDNGSIMQKTSINNAVTTAIPLASQAEAEAGTDNFDRMSALRVKQSIASEIGSTLASAAQGLLASNAIQPSSPRLIPDGGSASQILSKVSGSDYDTGWITSTATTAVSYAAQTLDSNQKRQVSENIGSGFLSGFRNVLINPLFAINQRGVSGTVTLAAGAYGHDRFRAGAGGCTYTFATSNGVTTITITSGSLQQVVEASVFSGRSGTYYLSWVGSAQGRIGVGAYGVSGAVSASCDGSSDMSVEFNSGTVSLVQFELDYPSSFSCRHIGQEVVLCQRYFEKSYALTVAPGTIPSDREGVKTWLVAGSTVQSGAIERFMAVKRATPAMTLYNPVTGGTASLRNYSSSSNYSGAFTSVSSTYTGYLNISASPILGEQFGHQWTADSEI